MSSRRRSRHRAVQVLYQCDVRDLQPEQALAGFYDTLYSEENQEPLEPDPFLDTLVYGVVQKKGEIDKLIEKFSERWRIERMPAVDRNILRLGVYEMLTGETPAAVVIDEAIELARKFSGDDSAPFINGLLDSVRKNLSPPS